MHYWSHGLGHAGVGGWMAVLVGGRMGRRVSGVLADDLLAGFLALGSVVRFL